MTFAELAVYFQRLEDTSSRIEMTKILADLFKESGEGEIGKICYLIQGRVVPMYEALEFGMADRFVIRALSAAYGIGQDEVTASFKKTGDLGIAGQNIAGRPGNKKAAGKIKVTEFYDLLYQIAQTGGEGSQNKKITAMAQLLSNLNPQSVRNALRKPLDTLRLGFSEMTILDALSWM